MATINYNGMELEEFISDKPVVFDKPVRALCWNNNGWQGGICEYVIAFIPRSDSSIAVTDHTIWFHMALLSGPPKPRRATNRELSRWLAQGNGECLGSQDDADTAWNYPQECSNMPSREGAKVRKWSDTEWHEPTVDYMGLDEVNGGENPCRWMKI